MEYPADIVAGKIIIVFVDTGAVFNVPSIQFYLPNARYFKPK